MLHLIYYINNLEIIGGTAMIRKKLSKLCVILLLVSVLLPFFDSIHLNNNPSYEHDIVLLDNMEDSEFIQN